VAYFYAAIRQFAICYLPDAKQDMLEASLQGLAQKRLPSKYLMAASGCCSSILN
jgi:hypothetical protein